MRSILILVFALVAVTAFAGEEALVTADGGVSFTTGHYTTGPNTFDVATDGSASIKFMWFADADRTSIVRTDPVATYGEATYALRSALPPRSFVFAGDGPDSCYVDVTTASEVIITW